jgi:hypothetical protein
MARPRRLYYDEDKKKYFYIIKNKRQYIKKPKGLSDKKLISINIKNIIGDQVRKKKRRKKRIIKVQKKVDSDMSKGQVGSLPVYLFKEKQNFPTLESIVKNEKKDNEKELNKLIEDLTKKINQPLQQGPTLTLPAGSPKRPAPPTTPGSPSKKRKPQDKTIRNKIIEFLKSATQPKNLESFESYMGLNYPQYDLKLNTDYVDIFNNYNKGTDIVVSETGEEEMKGSGKDDGLYNDEISKILKSKVKDFIPVIPSDKVNDMLRYVKQGDKRFGFVVNTNPSTSDGSGKDGHRPGHWRAVFIDNENPDFESAEYFDPLAEGIPEKSLLSTMKKISEKMNPEKMFKFKINWLKRQADNTGTCGYHCIDFLNRRYNGEDWADATGYNSYIEKVKPDDSHTGEKEIDKKIKKFNSYL